MFDLALELKHLTERVRVLEKNKISTESKIKILEDKNENLMEELLILRRDALENGLFFYGD